jgi:serine/threonine-protein kinase RsbT
MLPTMATARDKLLHALTSHLSSAHAQSILARALRKSGMSQRALQDRDLPELIPHVVRAASLFVRPDDRDKLEATLRWLTRSEAIPAQTIPVTSEPDIVVARSRARQMCAELGAGTMTAQKVATVVSELARNIVLYTSGGQIELIPRPTIRTLLIRATDSGGGIANIDDVLGGRYKSKTGLGMGILGAKRISQRFEIDTGRHGTRVEAEMAL